MSSIYEKIDNSLETFLSTLKRFPLASFAAFTMTMIFLVLIDQHNYNSLNVIIAFKIAFVATLGIVLFPALQLLSRSSFFPLLGLVLLAIYYSYLPHNINNANQTIIVRHVLLIVALFSMIIWAPFIGRKSDNDSFWQYAQSILFGLIVAILFSAIVYVGLTTALYSIEELFGFNVQSIRYVQLGLMVFGIFGINFFLSQIPKHPLFMQIRPYTKIKRIFSKNILAPIAIVYFLILYAYTAKILMSMNYPSGTLSWIIVAFSFVAIVSFLFLSPYLKKSSLTQRFIWLAIFLQTIMLGMALWIRVEEYGITYNRYLLAMFGLWLALMSLYFILFGKAQQKWLFFFATVFILISQFGTYSAKNITQKNQTTRLVKLIETAHPRSEKLDMKKKYEISDGIQYIQDHYGIGAFEKIIPHILKEYKRIELKSYMYHNFSYYATKELGFKFVNKWEWLDYQNNKGQKKKINHYFHADRIQNNIKVKGYNRLITYNHSQHGYVNPRFSKNSTILISNNQFTVKTDNNSTTFDLSGYANKLLRNEFTSESIPYELLIYEDSKNNLDIKIFFYELTLSHDGNITDFDSQILLKYEEK